ncbi:hypothetical protein G7083_07150 [Vibrio sp. HDW18]|uniref:hypothetical protein n=1 Tax=Vibrio sp. HDW18 TaxID=2714948 RepID=UPI00140D52D4|nr:hypothetical protein [Vibrio sp. HDW18]QIL85647.1 hypothetical protein G7083_07150 [Vibrio sp. HDW18]
MKAPTISSVSLRSIIHLHSRSGSVNITSVKNTDQRSGADNRMVIKAAKPEQLNTIIFRGERIPPPSSGPAQSPLMVNGQIVPPAPTEPPPRPPVDNYEPNQSPDVAQLPPSKRHEVVHNPLYSSMPDVDKVDGNGLKSILVTSKSLPKLNRVHFGDE